MLTTNISNSFGKIKATISCVVIEMFVIASLMLLPYELFFISALIGLLLLRYVEKNLAGYPPGLDGER